jgi:hypothetical protein
VRPDATRRAIRIRENQMRARAGKVMGPRARIFAPPTPLSPQKNQSIRVASVAAVSANAAGSASDSDHRAVSPQRWPHRTAVMRALAGWMGFPFLLTSSRHLDIRPKAWSSRGWQLHAKARFHRSSRRRDGMAACGAHATAGTAGGRSRQWQIAR